MENQIISASLTLRMSNDFKCYDNTDVIRLNMLAMDLSTGNHTIESIKSTIGFRAASSNFNLSDDYLKELIEQANELQLISLNK